MAYELDLTDEQYEAVYEINLDFLLCLNNPEDLNGVCWATSCWLLPQVPKPTS